MFKLKPKIDNVLGWILSILLAVMVLDVLWGVFTRYIMAEQSSWTDELARFLMIWVGILGAAYASGKNQHIAIDLLPNYLSDKNKIRLNTLVNVLIILFIIGVFIVGGSRYVYISFKLGQTSPALNLPMGLVYLVLPISGLLIVYYCLNRIKTR